MMQKKKMQKKMEDDKSGEGDTSMDKAATLEGNGKLAHPRLLKFLGIPTPRNPHYQALAISLVWPTSLSYPGTEYLVSQEYNRDIPFATTIQE